MPAKIYYESKKEHHRKKACHLYHDNKEHVLEYQKKQI